MNKKDSWLSPQEWQTLAIALVLCLIARGSAFVSATFNVDDLMYWSVPFDFNTVGLINFRDGRFIGPVIAAFEDALGVHAGRSFMLAACSMTLCLALMALLICKIWKIEKDVWASSAAVALLVLHPYQADLFTWKIALLNGGIPFVLTFIALHYGPDGRRNLGLAVAAIVLAFGIHQLPLQMAAAVLALALPIGLVRGDFDARRWIRQVGILLVGLVLYAVAAKLVIAYAMHAGSLGRDKLILFSEPLLVVARAWELMTMFAGRDPLIGWLTRAVLAGLLLFIFFRISMMQPVHPSTRARNLLVITMALAAAMISSVALTIVPYAWMPAFRNFMGVGVVWSAIAVLALSVSVGTNRKVVCGAIGIVLFAFIGSNNQVLSDQQRVNQRDLALMNRITSAVENLDGPEEIERIAFVGTTAAPLTQIATAADFSTGWHGYGTTLSVFAVYWPTYLSSLHNEVTGRYSAPSPEKTAWAEAACGTRQSWPAPGAVFGRGSLAVVCLGPPARFRAGPFDLP